MNDCLHVGPSLNPLLFEILVRFREKRIAFVGDIEKAFLNGEVDERDRDFCGSMSFKIARVLLCIGFVALCLG